MPFGLSGAPAMFNDDGPDVEGTVVGVYLDDVVIHSSWREHLHHLGQVMQRLQHVELTVKLKPRIWNF